MIRICGRDLSNVKHNDRLLASSWFVPGIENFAIKLTKRELRLPFRSI